MSSTQRLGKGLRALIPEVEAVAAQGEIHQINLKLIEANPYQPRQQFDQERLEELAQSIKDFGLLEPVILRPKGDKFEIVAGERRVRATEIAGLKEIPAILRDYSDLEMMQVALIENLQRENLNPIEEAEGFHRLMQEFGFTQNQVAESVGKKRSTVANTLRLLKLGPLEQQYVQEGLLSLGHAKVLLGVSNDSKRAQLGKKVVKEGLSVRELEGLLKKPKNVPRGTFKVKSPELVELEDNLQRQLGTKVSVSYKQGAGKIAIEYYSDEELERLLDLFRSIH